jgi:ribonuclease E
MRSIASAAIQLLRTVEARAADDRVESVHVDASPEVALYLLNEKRTSIADIEADCHVAVRIEADEDLKTGEFKIEGRADGNVIQPRPMQPIDLRKLKPLPPPAPDEIEEEDEEIIEGSDEEDDEHDEHDHDHDHDDDEDSEEESSSDADDDEDDDRGRRGRRGRRGGRRRRGGRDRGDRDSTGLEIVEPSDEEGAPVAAREEGGRDDGRGNRRRRRRGGRDRDRSERNKTPDIAADGGEMLDAIASAPFLVLKPALVEGTPPEPEHIPAQAAAIETPPVFEAPLQDEPEVQTPAEAREPAPAPIDHEIAASSVEVQQVKAADQPAEEAAQAEIRRHAIHGAPEDTETGAEKAPRKSGWWSRRKTG